MKTTPQLRGEPLRAKVLPLGTLTRESRGSGWKCWQAHFHFKGQTRDTEELSPSCGHEALVTGSLPLSVPLSVPYPLPCSLITLTKAPAAPFPSGHRSQAVPRARPCPQWVSPVPAPCPQCQPRVPNASPVSPVPAPCPQCQPSVLPALLVQSPPLLLLGWEGAFFGPCFCHLAFKCNESSRC